MARVVFGGSFDFPTGAAAARPSLDPGTVWDAATGGSQITDLLTMRDQPVTTLTTALCATDGYVRFKGPDDGTSTVWIQTSAASRIQMGADVDVTGVGAASFSTGWGPGFGCEGTAPAGEGVLPFTDAYQLDSTPAGTSTGGESVDDEWFTWDSEAVGDALGRIYINRPGFYWVSMFVSLSAPATDPWELKFQSGNTTFHRHVPGGFGAAGFFDCAVVPLGGVPYVYLQFDAGDNVGLEIATSALIFVPMFVP